MKNGKSKLQLLLVKESFRETHKYYKMFNKIILVRPLYIFGC